MSDEVKPDAVREVRVEGFGWLVVVAALLALIAAAFLLGRWVERESAPGDAGLAARDPVAVETEAPPPLDVAASANYFDAASAPGQGAEPGRQVREQPPPASATAPPVPARAAAAPGDLGPGAGGAYYVQVFATRDRPTAEELIRELQGQGYRVRLFSEREAAGELLRVRVGGYVTEDEAREAVLAMKKLGHAGAFVKRID